MSCENEFPMGFPFKPYQIQEDLMHAIHQSLDESKIAILESPTGTGKSLSLICGALSWLQKHNDQSRKELLDKSDELKNEINKLDQDKDWLQVHGRKKELGYLREDLLNQLQLFEWKDARSKELNELRSSGIFKQQSTNSTGPNKRKLETDEMQDSSLVEYQSDDEDTGDNKKSSENKEEEERQVKPKIFYACRTHSQLAQFVSEVVKTRYASSIRLVSLASRANLCVNPAVNKAKSVSLINDRCTELMNSKSKCSYVARTKQTELRDQLLAEPQDIEDMFKGGSTMCSCPYYAARAAIPEAELIVLPYNILLHSKTRQSWGLDLKGSIVIIDEAHNLLETISAVHSAEITLGQVSGCLNQLTAYSTRYGKQLNPKNLLYIKQLSLFLKSIVSYIKCNQSNKEQQQASQLLATIDFVVAVGIDGLNLFKLINYCRKSQLARKLFGFSTSPSIPIATKGENSLRNINNKEKTQKGDTTKATGTSAFLSRMKKNKTTPNRTSKSATNKSNDATQPSNCNVEPSPSPQAPPSPPTSPLYSIIEFIECLTNPASDGRVLITKDAEDANCSSVRYFLLNSAQHFKDLVTECRSLILAGGTMRPFAEYTQLLFKPLEVSPDRLITFSCGHVIPNEHVLPVSLGKGVSGSSLNFSFANRCTFKLIDEAGQTLSRIVSLIPGGVVVFFPSYDYLESVHSRWTSTKLLSNIEAKGKKIFREPKQASSVAKVLAEYSRANKAFVKNTLSPESTGGILFSVVGGKMSEGINFSNEMCRCVIVIGMPYPNQRSLQLQEKMTFYDQTLGNGWGKFYYENLCFKAINQSIGRAIRHANDFSAIILMDERYASRRDIKNKLPKWIAEQLVDVISFASAQELLKKFFQARHSVKVESVKEK